MTTGKYARTTRRAWVNVPARTVQQGDFLRSWGRVSNVVPASGKAVRVCAENGQFNVHMDANLSVYRETS